MRKLIIFSLITAMSFSLLGCSAETTSPIKPTSPLTENNENEPTTEEPTTEELTTEESTTEEPTTVEPTTEALLDDGKMSEYVTAAQKAFEEYKTDYEKTYDEIHPYTSFAFCDFNLDSIPELFITIPDVYSNFNGYIYLYKDNKYILGKQISGYETIQSYSNSDGNTLLLCTSYGYTDYDHLADYTFSADVDTNYYIYIDLDKNDPDYYVGQSFTPRNSNQDDPSHYYNSANILITEEEFNNNIKEVVKSYVKNDIKYSYPEIFQSGNDQTTALSTAYSNYLKAISK